MRAPSRSRLLTASLASLAVLLVAASEPRQKKPKIDLPALLDLHNKARAEAKLGKLTLSDKLVAAAKVQAKDMADQDKMAHEGSDGSTPDVRVKAQGYHFEVVGENVAMGQKTAAEVMRSWMESPHHKDNILRPEFTEVGLACYVTADGVAWWCADFGKPWPTIDPAKDGAAMLSALNEARAEGDALKPFKPNAKLAAAAQKHAQETADAGKFIDREAGAKTPVQRAQAEGYAATGISLSDAIGHADAAKAVKSWLGNEGSRKVLMGKYYEDVGIGVATDKDGVPYWSVMFGKPKPAPGLGGG